MVHRITIKHRLNGSYRGVENLNSCGSAALSKREFEQRVPKAEVVDRRVRCGCLQPLVVLKGRLITNLRGLNGAGNVAVYSLGPEEHRHDRRQRSEADSFEDVEDRAKVVSLDEIEENLDEPDDDGSVVPAEAHLSLPPAASCRIAWPPSRR